MRLNKFLTESIEDKGIFKAIFMAGQSAAGKSYVLSNIKSGSIEPRIVNVDTWIEHLHAKYDSPLHQKSKLLTVAQLYQYINSVLPLFIDSTSTDPAAMIVRYNILENLGYDLGLVFVNTSLETSLKRVEVRNKEGKRVVPLDKVKEYYEKTSETKEFLKGKFPYYQEIQNNDGEFTQEVALQAFRKTTAFYSSEVKNPLGKRTIEKMRNNGYKYLVPGVYDEQTLKSIVTKWYRTRQ